MPYIWKDREGANGADDLRGLLKDMGLFAGKRLGVELDTQGLTAKNWRMVKGALVKGPETSSLSGRGRGLYCADITLVGASSNQMIN